MSKYFYSICRIVKHIYEIIAKLNFLHIGKQRFVGHLKFDNLQTVNNFVNRAIIVGDVAQIDNGKVIGAMLIW